MIVLVDMFAKCSGIDFHSLGGKICMPDRIKDVCRDANAIFAHTTEETVIFRAGWEKVWKTLGGGRHKLMKSSGEGSHIPKSAFLCLVY